MDGQMHSIGKAIRPLFADPVTYKLATQIFPHPSCKIHPAQNQLFAARTTDQLCTITYKYAQNTNMQIRARWHDYSFSKWIQRRCHLKTHDILKGQLAVGIAACNLHAASWLSVFQIFELWLMTVPLECFVKAVCSIRVFCGIFKVLQ